MNCKNCENKRIIERDGFQVRCECIRKMNVLASFEWSEADKSYMKFKKQLDDKTIIYLHEENGQEEHIKVSLHDTIDYFIKNREKSKQENLRILLKGTNGRGKSQFAVTLALEILARMDLKKQDLEIDHFFFFNPMDLITENKLFNEDRKNEIIRKIEQANVLILDEVAEELEMFSYNAHEKTYIPNDKRVHELQRMIKYILDHFKGIIIMTSNKENPEEEYKKVNPRMHSRLFTTGSMMKYLFLGKGDDLRSQKQSDVKNDFLQNVKKK